MVGPFEVDAEAILWNLASAVRPVETARHGCFDFLAAPLTGSSTANVFSARTILLFLSIGVNAAENCSMPPANVYRSLALTAPDPLINLKAFRKLRPLNL